MEELKKIKSIIDNKHHTDISKITRKYGNPDLLKIYSKIAKDKTAYSLEQIGMAVNRNHATIIHHYKSANDLLEVDKSFRLKFEAIEKMIPDFEPFEKISEKMIQTRIKSHLAEIRKLKRELERRKPVFTEKINAI